MNAAGMNTPVRAAVANVQVADVPVATVEPEERPA